MRFVGLLFASGLCFAQTLVVDAGSVNDRFFSGGITYTDPTLGPAELQDLRYGSLFTYHIPTVTGLVDVKLTMEEPTKTGPGQRSFTVAVNGQVSSPLDLFVLAGLKVPYVMTVRTFAPNGFVDLRFQVIIWNALVSKIEVTPVPAPSATPTRIKETPAGTIDGVNKVFTLSKTPISNDQLDLYQNGLLMTEGQDYSLLGNTITFFDGTVPQPTPPPGPGAILQAMYVPAS